MTGARWRAAVLGDAVADWLAADAHGAVRAVRRCREATGPADSPARGWTAFGISAAPKPDARSNRLMAVAVLDEIAERRD